MKAAYVADENNAIYEDLAIMIGGNIDEETARLNLMNRFARITLGDRFKRVDTNVSWHIWQTAEANGFRIKIMPLEVSP